ncbi:N-6 DNA methylase [Flavobacterium sp.]|uniref:HsdM family class I SAM-dependent methyltransferase n=1 Tax=Flavobacterium sp. TaxID=239 RepID=UPI00260E1FFD|nr:N-6 DNA methylase [Flavobacterium sp.]
MATINSILRKKSNLSSKFSGKEICVFHPDSDPLKTLESGRIMAKAWAKTLPQNEQLIIAQNFVKNTMSIYWQTIHGANLRQKPLPILYSVLNIKKLDNSAMAIAEAMGEAAGQLNVIEAAYQLGNLYTAVLPESLRSENGIFYTPPSLTRRLIDMATDAGTKWSTASVADPACGGGAFLAPVALKMAESLPDTKGLKFLEHIEKHLKGFELDPFAAWLTQIFLEVSIKDKIIGAGRRLKPLVTICDTLSLPISQKFDLVIGNPPYGKVTLSQEMREKYKDGLFGHANLYGLFTQLAIQLVKRNGIIGFLTPTSFLSGEYFKSLRSVILQNTNPVQADFVSIRKGFFEDVLQETMLATYKKISNKTKIKTIAINEIIAAGNSIKIANVGSYKLPIIQTEPWIIPRNGSQSLQVPAMSLMKDRLSSWGFKVCTGQLVWNRHKPQLSDQNKKNSYPVVWAESVSQDGQFNLKADKKNHSEWFHFLPGNDFLLTTSPCVLLQRTTSKEQEKRLNAAVLPQKLLTKRKAVVIENHLNLVVPTTGQLKINLEALAAFLNSTAVNDAFRTISGSVAVSAYELEALPLPKLDKLNTLSSLVQNKADKVLIEEECRKLYSL